MLLSLGAGAKLSVRQPCSDGMVLQQKSNPVVWGHASAGVQVTVTTGWDGKSYKASTDGKGIWKVNVQTPEASYTPYNIRVKGDGGELTISDVLIGEVWIASGQSNMEMPVRGYFNCPVEGSAEVIADTRFKGRVRMFYAGQDQADDVLWDLRKDARWLDANPAEVAEMSATAFFFARQLNLTLDVPVGIVAFPYGGTRVESWLPREILEGYGTEGYDDPHEYSFHNPCRMYNAMQHPLQGYTAKGFIWYQGCSNVGAHEVFADRMKDLVERWRKDWGDENAAMPFYQVEIAPYRYWSDGQGSNGAALRQAQHDAAAAIPNGGIVVTNDLAYSYEADQIHPCQKEPVGRRLAYLALHRDYGFESIPCYSPEAVEAFRTDGNGSEICVRLTNCPNGLDRWQEIEGLEVCGSEHIFKPVTFAYFEWAGYLRIRCEGVWDPCEVRYGWGDFRPGNLHNAEGLPVAPFDIKLK